MKKNWVVATHFLYCGNRVQKNGGRAEATSQNRTFAEQIARKTGVGSETR